MPFDGLMLAAVRSELEEKLTGARIEKIYQPEQNDIYLHLSRPRERHRLVISAHPRDARAHMAVEKSKNAQHPPLFCMVLRKHLEGGIIKSFTQPSLERILKIDIKAKDELGHFVKKILICEFMGKHSNIILLDPENGSIIDGIRKYSHAVSRHREVLPGRQYITPPSQEKLSLLNLHETAFRNILLNSPLDNKVEKVIQSRLEGISSVMSREIVYRAGLPASQTVNYCGEHEMRILWQTLELITGNLSENSFNPTLITDNEDTPVDFSAFDLAIYENYVKKHEQASNILESFFSRLKKQRLIEAEKQSLSTLLNKEIKRVKKKIKLQHDSSQKAQNADMYRIKGELLSANFYQLKKGLSQITAEDFYSEAGDKISIALNPNLTPSENVQAYFKKYTKARNTRTKSLEQAQKNQLELDYLQGVLTALEQSTELINLREIRQELVEQGYIKTERHNIKKTKEKQPESQPKHFVSSDGFTILVGRNNKQNDRLTMKIATSKDIWLHTKEIAGSHVIIKCENAPVPDQTIFQAAVLAAYHSQARDSQNVPVDYTQRKNVKKPRGVKPGYVIYEQQQTAVVTPNEKLVNSLINNDIKIN
ncbi:MAG: NFACT family protein [Clostridiales bacterium]|nr:NFACT family protein [Clostridiales bacterium]MCF8022731.1 NFACT family protein [Clostridiales bacterium]